MSEKKFPEKNLSEKIWEKVGPTVCSRRLQPSAGARKKPPVGGLNFLVIYNGKGGGGQERPPPVQNSVEVLTLSPIWEANLPWKLLQWISMISMLSIGMFCRISAFIYQCVKYFKWGYIIIPIHVLNIKAFFILWHRITIIVHDFWGPILVLSRCQHKNTSGPPRWKKAGANICNFHLIVGVKIMTKMDFRNDPIWPHLVPPK